MLEKIGLKKLQKRRSIAKLKMLHSFYADYKFVTPSLLPSKARNTNLHFKPILGQMKVYDGSLCLSTVRFWKKKCCHLLLNIERFSGHVYDLGLQHFA